MALPLVNGVIEVGFHWQIGEDSSAITKLHFSATPAPFAQADLNTMATAISSAAGTSILGQMSGAVALLEVTCTDLGSAVGTQGLDGTKRTGSNGGTGVPAQVCTLANYKIARRYRGGKPRSYWPMGIATQTTDAQTWNNSFVTACQTALNTLLAAINGHAFGALTVSGQVSVSYYQPGGTWSIVNNRPKYTPHVRATPLLDPVVNAQINPKIATQRRRMLRG